MDRERLISYFSQKYPYTDFHELNFDWLMETVMSMDVNTDTFQSHLDALKGDNAKIMALYDAITTGNFPDEVKQAFYDWMALNAVDLVGRLVHNVFFGLTRDGYFVAFIPDGWDDIIFGTTGLDDFPEGIPYGHLTLSY